MLFRSLLMDGAQTCTYPSPYVNQYEDIDNESNLGEKEKLTLELRILEELKDIYLSHNIPQKTRIIALRSFIKFKPFSLYMWRISVAWTMTTSRLLQMTT